ncbi:MAG: ABC transporter ATP-binding protein/permease [Oscillospiraceae bacterium]|nr:ABC transporter ATP-binding protein/permease [Oscillospiraceae bacterium]
MMIRLLRMARKHWGTLLVAVAGLIGASVMNLVTPEIVRRLTASMGSVAGITMDELIMLAIILVAAYLLRAGCRFVAMSISHLAAWRFVADLTFDLYDKLQSLSLRYYKDKQTGQLMSRVVNDTRQIEILVAHALPDLFSSALMILGVTIMLFRINAPLAALTLVPVPLVVYAGSLFSKKVSPLFRINQEVLGDLNGALQDNLSGMKEIQAFGQEARESERMNYWRRKYAQVNIRANFANGIFHPGVEFLTSLGTVVVIVAGGYMGMRGDMAVSDVVGFLMYLSLFYQPLSTLARLVEDVQTASAGAVRVFDIIDAAPDVAERPDAIDMQQGKGQIAFNDVSFAYEKGEPVLHSLSFDVQPGQMIALVGPTGVGKTTIVSLLERFYDPDAGTIEIDGQDIRGLTLHSLRAQISLVLQDVFLFNGSVAENIAYGAKNATREQVIAAAKVAHADEFIAQMPEGYDTPVGERGARLSGGQKQRIAIARAVLRDAPILVLDEATSAVDNETEAEIQRAIERFAGKRTMIVIAHRLSTVRRADRILVIRDGHIAEQGTHEELLHAGGLYQKLTEASSASLVEMIDKT